MSNYGFSTTIPYGTDLFEVTGAEYCEWEDAMEKVDSTDDNAMQWVTYDVLMNNGYFVQQPKNERPNTSKQSKVETLKPLTGGVGNPGFRDVISGDTREPVWTQSKILTERDKLLKEREKIQTLKEEALQAKIREQRWFAAQRVKENTIDLTFYKPNGEPYKFTDWLGVIVGAFIVISLLAIVLR